MGDTMQQTTTALPDEMRSWIEDVTKSTVTGATRRAGGGRNEGWLIALLGDGDRDDRAFLRWDRSDPAKTGDPWTVRREAEIYRALSSTDLPIARFIAVHPERQALLLEVVDGDGRFSAVTDEARATAIAQDFMSCLARLHRLDLVALGLAPAGSTIESHVHAQLDEIEALIAFRGGVPAAELGIAMRWLRANVPAGDGPPVLVQGDTGPGNFMFDGDRVCAIVDWELAHPGDPMDDLAWVSLRSVQEPFPDLEERFAEYQDASGHTIDLDRIRYYRVLAEAKIMAMGHGLPPARSAGDGGSGGGDAGGRLIFGQLHRRLLVESLRDAMRLPLSDAAGPPSTAADGEEWHGLYGVVLAQLRDVVTPRMSDGFALQRTKGLARVIKYLEAVDLDGRAFAAEEVDDLAQVLGTRPASLSAGREQLAVAVRDRTVADEAALRVVSRRVERDGYLLRSASGAFANRHYDPLSRYALG
jgi:aminoglycoside phosphotransferase (APT) family kinase protein